MFFFQIFFKAQIIFMFLIFESEVSTKNYLNLFIFLIIDRWITNTVQSMF